MTRKKIAYLEIRSRTFTTTKYTFFLRKNTSLKGVYRSFWPNFPNIMSPGITVKTRNSLNVSRSKFDVRDFCTYQTLFLSTRDSCFK